MRRAIIATAGTAAAVAALLSYKSSNAVKASRVPVNIAAPAASSITTQPTTTQPPNTQPSNTQRTTTEPHSGAGSTTTTAGAAPAEFTGTDVQYNYGDIQLRVTTDRGKITQIDVVREGAPDRQSQTINGQAIPILAREALAAQGVDIDVVSGATFTSQAFAQALRSALEQAGQ